MPKIREPDRNAARDNSAFIQAIHKTMKRAERTEQAAQLRTKLKQLAGFYGRAPGLWAIEKIEQHIQEQGTSGFTAKGFAKAKAKIVRKTKTNFTMNFGQNYKNNPKKRMELLRKLKRGLRMELSELLNPAEPKNGLARRILSDLESRRTIIDAGDQKRFADETVQALRETRQETLAALMKYVDGEIGKIVRGMGKVEE